MIPSIGHRFPLLLCCEVVSPRQTFLVRKSADWNFFLVSRSAFPAVVEQLWDAHTMGLGAPRAGWLWWECRRQAEPFLGAAGLLKVCIWLQDPPRLCEKNLGFVSWGDLAKPDGIKSHYWLLSVLMCSFPFCSRNLFSPFVCHRPREMKRCFQASL